MKLNFKTLDDTQQLSRANGKRRRPTTKECNVRKCYPTLPLSSPSSSSSSSSSPPPSSVVVVVAHGAASWLRLNGSVLHTRCGVPPLFALLSCPPAPVRATLRRAATAPCGRTEGAPATHQHPALGHLASTRRAVHASRTATADARGYTAQRTCACATQHVYESSCPRTPYVNRRSNNREASLNAANVAVDLAVLKH
ncbi:uncharacterized protein LOC114255352 isoform X2 [Monomorium pharaonis]|uniref:uncharacterized protein LOC114255352 isoform X2 n=1 Tax=Monomorium pharaonis TaxID=307658 RepID=UPI0017474BF5|nr:uncharacterized protein LOC114255352 isoform X2 [Monomorium pharaonis]